MNIYNKYQACKQLFGSFYISLRNSANFPCPNNYSCKVKYILPFEGYWTVVNGGVTEEFSHSWGVLTQRFAYDFLVLDEKGNTYAGDLTNPQNHYCYGLSILAPADGKVEHVENRCADSVIDKEGNAHCNSRHICGNHIVIKHAECEYSFLAHLMKDSIAVKVGDNVKQGQCIAKCGNTGNSSQPHLHFHLQNKKSFYTALGLPIEFAEITARPKENYCLLDPRQSQSTYINISGKQYIGRGQEVINAKEKGSEQA